jgi:hypothetical protein
MRRNVSVEDVLPEDDFDTDGQTNGDEDEAGTDLVDPSSLFALDLRAAEPATAGVVVSWNTVAERVYTLKHTTNLVSVAGSSNVPGYVEKPGSGSKMSYTNPAPSGVDFHWVIVARPGL